MKSWRPYTQEQTAEASLKVESALGAYVHIRDERGGARDGGLRRVFDGISSWWLVTHGHGQPEIAAAVAQQSEKLAQVVFADFTHEPAERFVEELGRFLPPPLSRAFFSDNGSSAVEVAMKMALQYQRQAGHPERTKFLAFDRAYHGDTCGAMSVSQRGMFTHNYSRLLFEIFRCPQPTLSRAPAYEWTEAPRAILDQHHSSICAVLIEPLLQGAGGMIAWPAEAVAFICAEARRHGILVIFDEVMTGFGRTGTLFAFEQLAHFDIPVTGAPPKPGFFIPDFLCLSKGLTGGFLPMGLTVTNEDVFSAFLSEDPTRMLFHGHSYTGNALSCAAALANLAVWQRDKAEILDRIARIHAAHIRALGRWSGQWGLPLKESRVCGAVGVVEFDLPEGYGGAFSRQVYKKCLNRGLFIRPLGSTLYLMPPYCSTEQEIEQAWDIIGRTAAETAADFASDHK